MLAGFLLIFFSIFLAQIGDKTQLLTLLLAARTKKHTLLFIGIMIGFILGVAFAVILGAQISNLVPHKILKILSSLLFILIGIFLFIRKRHTNNKVKKSRFNNELLSTILVISLADFGDKTQIALAIFAITYHPLLVFIAGISALGLSSILAMYFSKILAHRIKEAVMKKVAGALFIIIGLFFLFI